MRFAFDVDGMILDMPDFFRVMISSLKAQGHEIFIVTDFDERYRAYREKELADLGIVYDALIITSQKKAFFEAENIDYALDDDGDYYEGCKLLPLYIAAKR